MSYRRLYYFKQTLQFRLETLHDYLRESSENLKQKQKELDNDLKNALVDVDDSDVSHNIVDIFLDENLKYYDDFPSLLNESSFIIIYSFFETNLARICKYARLDINASKGMSFINAVPSSSYIKDSKSYLTHICGLSLKAKEPSWRKLDVLRDFRNFIAHNGLDLKQTKNASEKSKKRKTITYVNRVFGKSITINDLEKCKIKNEKLVADMLRLVEDYLFFVIEKALKKAK
ncbi:MAG: hypothetical protein ACTHJN_10815 [Ginsengibacter sp.]